MVMTRGIRTKVMVVRRHDAASMKTRTSRAWVKERIITLMLREICDTGGGSQK